MRLLIIIKAKDWGVLRDFFVLLFLKLPFSFPSPISRSHSSKTVLEGQHSPTFFRGLHAAGRGVIPCPVWDVPAQSTVSLSYFCSQGWRRSLRALAGLQLSSSKAAELPGMKPIKYWQVRTEMLHGKRSYFTLFLQRVTLLANLW